MFDKQFYPTPPSVIELMLADTDLVDKVVLEPSAGKGNIVDYAKGSGARDVLCCEKNTDLATIVQKKARFLKHDFFSVSRDEVSHVDVVLMNPPFLGADRHIQHAWEILPDGGEIIAICNAETIKQPYTRQRESLHQLVKDFGTSQMLGSVFSEAERTTDVNVALIKLYKPGSTNGFGDYFDENEEFEDATKEGIIPYNAVRECVQRYVGAVEHYDKVVECGVKMQQIAGIFGVEDISFSCTVENEQVAKVQFQKALQKKAWKWIFDKLDMRRYMTQSLKEELNKFVEQQQNVPFTMRNIYKMVELVVGTHGQRMDKVMEEVFDKLTTHYHENRFAVEGWKTNSHFIMGKKFIMPRVVESSWSGDGSLQLDSYANADLFDDFQKALCWMTGVTYSFQSHSIRSFYSPSSVGSSHKKFRGKWYDSEFFQIKGFKKGTIHCKFKSEELWARFNQHIARIKGFPLPESMAKS